MTSPVDPTDLAEALEALHQSEQRVLRTVDSLRPDDFRAPSVLPGWTRAHVVAHLALNAEGMAGAVEALGHGREVPMYESDERRDTDIEELAQADPPELRERLFAAGQALRDAFAGVDDHWGGDIPRTPGGPRLPVASLPAMRRREVEIHHADLDAGYRPDDWPDDFRMELLELVAADRAADADCPPFTIRATDTIRTWDVGAEQPVIEGTAAALAWWLVGRGSGEGLACDTAPVPRLGPWRRTPAK